MVDEADDVNGKDTWEQQRRILVYIASCGEQAHRELQAMSPVRSRNCFKARGRELVERFAELSGNGGVDDTCNAQFGLSASAHGSTFAALSTRPYGV
jgi:hypothetical protein